MLGIKGSSEVEERGRDECVAVGEEEAEIKGKTRRIMW